MVLGVLRDSGDDDDDGDTMVTLWSCYCCIWW